MHETRHIYISFEFGRWIARVLNSSSVYDWPDLGHLIAALQKIYRAEPLLFVVNKASIEGSAAAEAQFLEASEKSGARVISSVEEF